MLVTTGYGYGYCTDILDRKHDKYIMKLDWSVLTKQSHAIYKGYHFENTGWGLQYMSYINPYNAEICL